jgi:hypothetical protein
MVNSRYESKENEEVVKIPRDRKVVEFIPLHILKHTNEKADPPKRSS